MVPAGDGFDVAVTVKNMGMAVGKESVQIYVSAPSGKNVRKPAKELKAFAKTGLLKPGTGETLHMHISKSDLASWDALDGWVVESGEYRFMAAASSRDIRLTKEIQF